MDTDTSDAVAAGDPCPHTRFLQLSLENILDLTDNCPLLLKDFPDNTQRLLAAAVTYWYLPNDEVPDSAASTLCAVLRICLREHRMHSFSPVEFASVRLKLELDSSQQAFVVERYTALRAQAASRAQPMPNKT